MASFTLRNIDDALWGKFLARAGAEGIRPKILMLRAVATAANAPTKKAGMRSINEATWKDGVAIEARSLVARLEGLAATCMANPESMLGAPIKQQQLESVVRQAVKLAEMIDHIEER